MSALFTLNFIINISLVEFKIFIKVVNYKGKAGRPNVSSLQ